MKFLILEIDNFLTIGRAAVKLSDTGLVVIQGKNEDEPSATSNGAGKSSIPDALMWALFGETARGVSGDAVVNEKAKKNCQVAVVIQDGDSVYQIIRYRKHPVHKNGLYIQVWNPADTFPMGSPTPITRGSEKETEALIVEILGCSKEVFCASIYAGQEAMPDLPRMTDKQLKVLIEEAAGVERLERAYELARGKCSDAQFRLQNAQDTVARDERQFADLGVRLDAAKKAHAEFEAGRASRAAVWEERAAAYAAQIAALKAKVDASGEAALTARRGEIAGALAEHSKVLAKREQLQRVRDNAEKAATQAAYQFDSARAKVAEIQKHIANAPLNVGKPCSMCSKPHTKEDLDAVIANLTAQLKEAAQTAALLKGPHEVAVHAAVQAGVELADFIKTIPDVSALTTEQAQIDAKLREIEGWRHQVALAHREQASAEGFAKSEMTNPNPHRSAVVTIAEQMKSLKVNIEATKRAVASLEADHAMWAAVMKVFSPAGVRAHILDTVTPFLNERTADYLSALSDGNITATWSTLTTTAKGELREKFNIEVENATGAKSFGGLSGGEKRKVRLATMLALQDLVASRATKPIDLWIGDEIDDALDPAGLERLMGILEQKARERGSVLVISHNELTDWADQVAVVTKKGGLATVDGALAT